MNGRLKRWWPLSLRILLGISFVYHGFPKLFTSAGHRNFTGTLAGIGFPVPGALAWLVGVVEFFGGIALIIGALVAVASALLVIEMLVALFTVHLPHGFSAINIVGMTANGPRFGLAGIELNLLYIAGLLALFIGGPGPLSVEEALTSRRTRGKKAAGATRPVTA